MSDGRLVVQSNNEGVPFVLANPDARDQPGPPAASPASCSTPARTPAAAGRSLGAAMSDPRPIGVFDSGVGGLTVLREIVRRTPGRIDGLPRRQRAGAVRRAPRRGGAGLLDPVARRARRARRQGHRRRLQHVDRGRPSAALRRRYDLPILGVIRPGASAAALATRNRRVGVIATPATIRSHAYFSGDQGREPRGRGLRARDADARARSSRPASCAGRSPRPPSPRRWRRCSANATRPASRSSRCRRARPSTRCCSAARTTRCFARSSRPSSGAHVAIVDSATATASALAELLDINGLGGATPAMPSAATHLQLTTGDPDTLPRARRPAVRGRVPGRRAGRARGGRPDEPSDRPHDGRPAWRDDRVWQAGFLIGSALGAAATVVGRHAETVGPARSRRLAGGRADRDRAARTRRPGALSAAELRAVGAGLRRGDGAHRAGAVGRARDASCRASSSARASSTGPAGSAPTSGRSRRSSASSRRTCSTRSCRPAADWPRRRWRSPTAG